MKRTSLLGGREGLDELWESYKAGNSDMIEAEKANYNLQLRYCLLYTSRCV